MLGPANWRADADLHALARDLQDHFGADHTRIGYEIPFTRHFYEYQPLRPMEEIAEDLRALEAEAEQLLEEALA